jgi:hypothetical protein
MAGVELIDLAITSVGKRCTTSIVLIKINFKPA